MNPPNAHGHINTSSPTSTHHLPYLSLSPPPSANIDEVIGSVENEISGLDSEIRLVIRGDSSDGGDRPGLGAEDGRRALLDAQIAIGHLFSRIKDIKGMRVELTFGAFISKERTFLPNRSF